MGYAEDEHAAAPSVTVLQLVSGNDIPCKCGVPAEINSAGMIIIPGVVFNQVVGDQERIARVVS